MIQIYNLGQCGYYPKETTDRVNTWMLIEETHSIYPNAAQCCFSIPSENIRKAEDFLMFSWGIEKQHWAVMG